MRWILVIFFCVVLCADARVGENKLQCAQRYGSPSTNMIDRINPILAGPGATNETYRYRGWRIRFAFVDGIACIADYQKELKREQPNDIADAEFQAILRAYQPEPWEQAKRSVELNPSKALSAMMHQIGDGPSWKSREGLLAFRRPGGRIIRIMNKQTVDAFEARVQKAKEASRPPPPQF